MRRTKRCEGGAPTFRGTLPAVAPGRDEAARDGVRTDAVGSGRGCWMRDVAVVRGDLWRPGGGRSGTRALWPGPRTAYSAVPRTNAVPAAHHAAADCPGCIGQAHAVTAGPCAGSAARNTTPT